MKPKKRILQDAAKRPIFCMWYFRWWYMVGLRTAKSQPECFRERKYWSCSCTPCVALGPIAPCTRFLYKIKANPYFGSKRANAPNIALSVQFPRWENLSPSYANPPRGSSNHFLQTWQHQGMQEDNTQATCHQNQNLFLSIWGQKEKKSSTEYSVLLPETITLCFVIQVTRQRRGLVTGVPFFTLSM